MALFTNLTPDQTKEVHKFFNDVIAKDNPDAELTTFPMMPFFDPNNPIPGPDRNINHAKEINRLSSEIEELKALVKSIFDGHVLIDGQFVKIAV